jgi:hypothetical protein
VCVASGMWIGRVRGVFELRSQTVLLNLGFFPEPISEFTILLPSAMPPKKAQAPPLTVAEQLLLRVASRITTAISYKEAHPEGDYSGWSAHLTKEVVSHCI